MIDLREQPWWTSADRAELDAFVHGLVDAVYAHREKGCDVCAGDGPCPGVHAAIERVVEWRDLRIRLSRAAWLRAQQDEFDQTASERRAR